MQSPDLLYLNALNTIPGTGRQALATLLGFFSSAEEAWRAPSAELASSGIPQALAERIAEQRRAINPHEQWEGLERERIGILTIHDEDYPGLLREIPTAPYLIYVKGGTDCLRLPSVAVVGSRKSTPYGQQAASRLSQDLARAGISVVSGLALGIDAIAHQGALDAGGRTIAVPGNSLDEKSIYPRSNSRLAQRIVAENGLLLSEFPVGTLGGPGLFPARNRIMAGMALGTLVVEAAEKSGTLITANLAADFNREVFVVPGSIFSPQSEGAHALIKKGAKLVSSVADILEELRFQPGRTEARTPSGAELTSEEEALAGKLSNEPTHIDIIARLTKLDTSTLSANLAMLEIKGAARNIGGQNYIKL